MPLPGIKSHIQDPNKHVDKPKGPGKEQKKTKKKAPLKKKKSQEKDKN